MRYWKEGACHGSKPAYENPGHHDPTSGKFRGGGPGKTSLLPSDADRVYVNAIPDPGGGTWWGRSSSGEYYRYSSHAHGKVHWSGVFGAKSNIVPSYVKMRFRGLLK